MPFNGSGTFVSLAPPDFPALPFTTILASMFNANMNDVFTNGLTKCITRDGQSPPTANLPMAGFKFTNLGAGASDTDSAQLGQTLSTRGQVGVVDWNTRVTNGIFEGTAASLQAPSTNFPPTTLLGELIVIAQGAVVDQIYKTPYFLHTRQKLAGVWTNWTDLVAGDNAFINSGFQVWQAGTALGAATGKRYLADMVWVDSVGSTYSNAQIGWLLGQSDVDSKAKFYLNTSVTSVAGAGNLCAIILPVEGARSFSGQVVTFSFYGQCNTGTRNCAIEFIQNFGTGGAPSAQTSTFVSQVTLGTTWGRKSVTFTVPSVAGKTLGSNANDYVAVLIWLDAGANFNARTGSLGQQSATWNIFGTKIELGQVATPYILPDESNELERCSRYYYNYQGNVNTYAPLAFWGNVTIANVYEAYFQWRTIMRAVPVTTINNIIAVGFNAAVTVNQPDVQGIRVGYTTTATAVAAAFKSGVIADARF